MRAFPATNSRERQGRQPALATVAQLNVSHIPPPHVVRSQDSNTGAKPATKPALGGYIATAGEVPSACSMFLLGVFVPICRSRTSSTDPSKKNEPHQTPVRRVGLCQWHRASTQPLTHRFPDR